VNGGMPDSSSVTRCPACGQSAGSCVGSGHAGAPIARSACAVRCIVTLIVLADGLVASAAHCYPSRSVVLAVSIAVGEFGATHRRLARPDGDVANEAGPVLSAPRNWPLLQGVDHGVRLRSDCHWSPPRRPAGARRCRHGPGSSARRAAPLGGDAGRQGRSETGGDEPESRGPVAGCEGDLWLGDAGTRRTGASPNGARRPTPGRELAGLDPFPDGEGV